MWPTSQPLSLISFFIILLPGNLKFYRFFHPYFTSYLGILQCKEIKTFFLNKVWKYKNVWEIHDHVYDVLEIWLPKSYLQHLSRNWVSAIWEELWHSREYYNLHKVHDMTIVRKSWIYLLEITYLGGNLCPFKILDLSGTWPLVWEIWTYMRTSMRMGSSMECGKVDLGQGLKCQKYQQWVGSEVEQLYMIWWYGFQCTLFNASQFLCPIIQVWRHTCLSISSSTGKFKLVENGEKAVDKVDSTIIEWMNDIPKKVCIGHWTLPQCKTNV